MRLHALRLHGFKSFADRTEVVFHDGITAIVGPNGCGKSNISDAIRWVLGEQRASAIRGARMDEAIFQGTVNRRPVNRAQVSMELSNEDGALPVPFEEVEISRTVYRDGGSDYALNRSSCRLRDIQDLCRDTGLGSNAYSIIENRMIDAILSDRADERRGLFEEAAGIGKYKDRRKSASRRLERAEADIQRLEDLIGEVESKVRSLARQKGRAERYGEIRDRRLAVDVSLARRQLDGLQGRLKEIREALDGGLQSDESLQAEIRTAEVRVERLRADRLVLEKERSVAAGRLDEIRGELTRWERELAVAAERGGHAERRLARIGQEREDARERGGRARKEREELVGREREGAEELSRLRSGVEAAREESSRVQEQLTATREELDRVEAREREVARRAAQLRGDGDAAEAQALELDRRAAHLEEEVATSSEELRDLDTQGDLFGDRVETLAAAVEAAREAVVAAREAVVLRRGQVEEARKREMAAQDRASSLRGRLAALQRLEEDREGVDPVIRALLDAEVEGVLGLLADFISAEPEAAAAAEAFLGVQARGVVVRDRRVARRVHTWFRGEWGKGGGLILLPLDAVPDEGAGKGAVGDGGDAGGASDAGDARGGLLLDRIQASGRGAPWVRVLLEGVWLTGQGDALGEGAGDRVAEDGSAVDRRGVMRIGNPLGATGLLERKEQLRKLEIRSRDAEAAVAETQGARQVAQQALHEAEESLEEFRQTLREAEDAHREARTEESDRSERRSRLVREQENLLRHLEATRTSAVRTRERAREARAELEGLQGEEEGLLAAREEARNRTARVHESWERARGEESRLTVELTRLEGELQRIQDRGRELEQAAAGADRRLAQLDEEEIQSRAEVESTGTLRRQGEDAMQGLFRRREEAEEALRRRDQRMAAVEEELAAREKRAREARAMEREASEYRHRLELEAGELTGRVGRIEERLEGEWGRSLAELLDTAPPVEGTEEELRGELKELVQALDRLGPVNMLAMEEHDEESARLRFLREQRDDLVEARDDLGSAIREINQTATRLFLETFQEIRDNFRNTFVRLFQGGECDIWLEDPEDPLESSVEIQASPRGKRTQRIDLLSGGERALTALSLLFGIYLAKPSPFCVLDEVDAPLDESNIGRFIRLLEEFKGDTQFVVITHNPRTIEAADWIYGVTMEEPGVSSIVGVRLEEALVTAAAGGVGG